MRVLVTAASKHGATAETAEAIADKIGESAVKVDVPIAGRGGRRRHARRRPGRQRHPLVGGGDRRGADAGASRHNMTPIAPPSPETPAWIDCFGATRAVDDARVLCPLRDRMVAVDSCLDCHHLSAMAEERDQGWECRLPDRIG